jgi:hypothetical protein
MPLIISKAGKNVTKVNRSAIDKESYLQKYIKDNPDMIPFEETGEDLRLVVVARELSTQSGPIDALGIHVAACPRTQATTPQAPPGRCESKAEWTTMLPLLPRTEHSDVMKFRRGSFASVAMNSWCSGVASSFIST